MDELTYNYNNSNRLISIVDATSNASGYPGGGGTITYDSNGNMLTMPDKGISTAIEYNYLNLPEKIVQSGNPTEYTYRSDGEKLQKTFTINSQNIYTDYLDGFVYTRTFDVGLQHALTADDSVTLLATTAHQEESLTLDDKVVKPIQSSPELVYFPTSEGFYDFENSEYIYQYKDHLGNVRLSYSRNSSGAGVTIKDVNSYYPFGLNHYLGISASVPVSAFSPSATYKNYKYNGKELQETGMYDYGARFYMPDIGRWGVVDPLAEQYRRWSPFNYAMNNPIRFIDPDGRGTEDWVKKDGQIFFDSRVTGNNVTTLHGEGAVNLGSNPTLTTTNANGDVFNDLSLNKDGSITDNATGENVNYTTTLGGTTVNAGDVAQSEDSWSFYADFNMSFDLGPQLRAEGTVGGVSVGVDLQRNVISNSDIENPGNPNMVTKDVTGGRLALSGFTLTTEKIGGKVVNTTTENNALFYNIKKDNYHTYYNEQLGGSAGLLWFGGSISFEAGIKTKNK